jgi:hypothetical protein
MRTFQVYILLWDRTIEQSFTTNSYDQGAWPCAIDCQLATSSRFMLELEQYCLGRSILGQSTLCRVTPLTWTHSTSE